MAWNVNRSVETRALADAHSGNVDHGEWTAPPRSEYSEKNCLGHDESAKGAEKEWGFPLFTSSGKLSAKGVGSALGYARKDAPELVGPLEKIDDAIKSHIHLSVLGDSGASKASVFSVNPDGTVSLEKELIRVGKFINPRTKKIINATPERLRHWCESGNAMVASGVRIPMNADHSLSAFASLGRLTGFEIKGDGLYGKIEATDQDCANVIRRNDCSIGYADFTDGTDKTWLDAIYHVAATQLPVITDLKQATAASHDTAEWQGAIYLSAVPFTDKKENPMSCELSADHLTKLRGHAHLGMANVADDKVGDQLCGFHARHGEQLSALRRCIPGSESCPPGEELSRTVQHLSSMKHLQDRIHGINPHLLSMTASEGDAALDAKLDELLDASKSLTDRDSTIAELRKQNVELSSRSIKDVPGEAVPFIREGLAELKNRLVASGFKPHAAEMLFNRAVSGDKVNATLCSTAANPFSGSNRALIFDLAEIILQGLGGPGAGSVTGGQALSRVAPQDTLINNEATRAMMEKMQKA